MQVIVAESTTSKALGLWGWVGFPLLRVEGMIFLLSSVAYHFDDQVLSAYLKHSSFGSHNDWAQQASKNNDWAQQASECITSETHHQKNPVISKGPWSSYNYLAIKDNPEKGRQRFVRVSRLALKRVKPMRGSLACKRLLFGPACPKDQVDTP